MNTLTKPQNPRRSTGVEERAHLSTSGVWGLMIEGCNAREIADYAHISATTARAWMQHAAHVFAATADEGEGT